MEVILRRPHEFKIGTLQDVRALFPAEWNPFWAAFGNRDTDELSYKEVGVPTNRIFIINPRSELRQVSLAIQTSTLSSLSAINSLVSEIFPPLGSLVSHMRRPKEDVPLSPGCSGSQPPVQEIFNDLHFWGYSNMVMDVDAMEKVMQEEKKAAKEKEEDRGKKKGGEVGGEKKEKKASWNGSAASASTSVASVFAAATHEPAVAGMSAAVHSGKGAMAAAGSGATGKSASTPINGAIAAAAVAAATTATVAADDDNDDAGADDTNCTAVGTGAGAPHHSDANAARGEGEGEEEEDEEEADGSGLGLVGARMSSDFLSSYNPFAL